MSNIFIIDDDKALCRSLELHLKIKGHNLSSAQTGKTGLDTLKQYQPDLVLLDLKLPDSNGLDILKEIKKTFPQIPVAMVTGQQDMQATIEAMKIGALDYLRKPFDTADVLLLLEKLHRVLDYGKVQGQSISMDPTTSSDFEIVGADKRIVDVIKRIGLLSRNPVNVLIQGESGTGKELIARALHHATKPEAPFIAVNCSAIVPTLFESEMFGHEKGAFTGAVTQQIGKLERATDGVIFLDEISNLPLPQQAKLLRALQEREIERVGGTHTIPFKAWIITASNKDLDRLVQSGEFREDLYFRLAVSVIKLPPLRERKQDIPLLVNYIINKKINKILTNPITKIAKPAIDMLMKSDWPGNVRELENTLLQASALNQGPVLTEESLISCRFQASKEKFQHASMCSLAEVERQHIITVLEYTDWNISQSASVLKISPTTLRKKIKDYHLKKSL
ncbi:sigma-54-dependent Fis family transcriptional regulator [bacterium]|nr:sigma-54-dependent Fis family transcriptional regulator [candidate division CSSED10-310 bacterium]